MLLYRYRQFDDYSLENLKCSTLWCSTLRAFNDPYELQFKLDIQQPGELDDLYDYWRARFPNRTFYRKTIQYDAEDVIKSSRDWYGVCCFSELAESPQLWAYYAAQQTGFCLGFDFPAQSSGGRVGQTDIHKVEYRDDCPRFSVSSFFGDSRQVAKTLQNLLTIKHTGWMHEKEWRFINWLPNQAVSYDPTSLKEILIGVRASQENVEKLRAICTQLPTKVTLRQPVLMHGTYRLGRDEDAEIPDIE